MINAPSSNTRGVTGSLNSYRSERERFYQLLCLLENFYFELGGLNKQPVLESSGERNDNARKSSVPAAGITDCTLSRRRFIENLAHLCETKKGGGKTSSIALEEKKDGGGLCFWLATNGTASNPDGNLDLKKYLSELKGLSRKEQEVQRKKTEGLVKGWLMRSTSRTAEEVRILSNCAKKLPKDSGILPKLQKLLEHSSTEGEGFVPLCHAAQELKASMAESKIPRGLVPLIESLARHKDAADELINDINIIADLLENYEVKVIPSNNLEHLSLDISLYALKERFCTVMEKSTGGNKYDWGIIEKKISEKGAFEPVVHSEVQVLDHFHKNRLLFAFDDKFIGTSRKACVCCQLYFEYHQADWVVPLTGGFVPWKWGQADFSAAPETQGQIDKQVELMERMSESLEKDVIDLAGQLKEKETGSSSQT